MKKSYLQYFLGALLVVPIIGCNSMQTTIAPKYQHKSIEVSSIGLAGAGSSSAFSAFIKHGYKVKELGSGENGVIEKAQEKGIPFVAIINPVGTEGSSWDGVFDYSMRVIHTNSEDVVWSAIAEYGDGILIDQVGSTKKAFDEMIGNFKKSFPPANSTKN